MKQLTPTVSILLGCVCWLWSVSAFSHASNVAPRLNEVLLGKTAWYKAVSVVQQPNVCSVSSITPTTVAGSCNENGTPSNYADDYFLVNVAVAFTEAPTTGSLEIKRGATVLASVPVGSLGASSYTFSNVQMPTAATGYTLTASFTALTCGANLNNYTPGASCCVISNLSIVQNSATACNNNGTASAADDYYTVDVQVTYNNIPTTGNLSLSGSGANAALFNSLNSPAPTVAASSLSGSTYVFQDVKFPAGVSPVACAAAFSAIPTCTRILNNISNIPSCSDPQCSITGVQFLNAQPCNSNGTNTTTDDYYTIDVRVNFTNPPTTGTLNLSGAGVVLNSPLPSVAASSLTGLTSYTFTAVRFPANGAATSFTAAFSASPNCTANVNNNTIVQPCSNLCNIGTISFTDGQPCNNNGTIGNAADDYYTLDVVVNYTNPPTTGTLNLTGADLSLNSPLPSVAVSSLSGGTYTFQNVRFRANGVGSSFVVAFSANPNCTRTVNNQTAVGSCSAAQCAITNATLSNNTGCNNNGTVGNAADDFYTVNVTVNYTNPPATGNLTLSGALNPNTVAVSALSGSSYTFTGVMFPANGAASQFTLAFTAAACSLVVNNNSLVPSCSAPQCSLSNAQFTNVVGCNNNGTTDPSDDYYTANLSVSYANPPATGTLNLTSTALLSTPPVVPVSSLSGGTYTFNAIRLRANGQTSVLNVAFSAANCALNINNNTTIASCSDPQCSISNVSIQNASSCNSNGTPNNPADDFYTGNVVVTYANPPASGTLGLSGTQMAALNSPLPSVPVASLSGTTYTFTGVKFPANGATNDVFTVSFSAGNNCSVNVNNTSNVPSCSTGSANCTISSASIANVSSCNNNGTPNNAADDYYTANVTVNYTNPPTSGNLLLNGTASSPAPSVAVSSLSGNSYTFTGVRFPANGQASSFFAVFSASPNCALNVNNNTVVPSCAVPQCAITNASSSGFVGCNNNGTTNISTDDYYTVNITVTYSNPPATGSLAISGALNSPSVLVSALSGNSYTFNGVRFPANGQSSNYTVSFSALPSCALNVTNNTVVQPCSTPQCTISSANLSNLTVCNNNSTIPNAADDYYTANVTVVFSAPPTTGTLNLGGSSILNSPLPSVAVSSISGNSYTFTGVRFPANNMASQFTASFSASPNCAINVNNSTMVPSCSAPQCSISNGSLSNVTGCNNNGTINNSSDDYYTASVTVTFANPPATGTLNLSGSGILNSPQPSIAVSSLSGTSYTFTGVRFPANGQASIFLASFSASPNCALSFNNNNIVQSCSTPQCSITNASLSNASTCNNNGTTNNSSDDYYTANVTVNFVNPPATGNLVLNGTASSPAPSVAVSSLSGGSYTFSNVRFAANGQPTQFSAAFTASPNCTLTINNNTIVPSCSVATGSCSIGLVYLLGASLCNNNGTPANPADDYYTATVRVFFSNPPATGTLNLSGSGILNSPQPSVAVSSLTGTSYNFIGVRFPANGSPSSFVVSFSANPACTKTVTNTTTVQSCSTGGGATCNISSLAFSNASTCNNNGTPSTTTDDYYTANVTVNYTNKPATGTLNLSGSGVLNNPQPSVAVGSAGATSYTFTGVRFAANGSGSAATATFSATPACTLTANNPIVVQNCSSGGTGTCSIGAVSLLGISLCNNNGTPSNPADDYYTATVRVNYTNPPTTGTLNLSGASILNSPQPSVPVSSLTGSMYNFIGVRFPANGSSSIFTVSFSANPSCVKTVTNITQIASCSP